MAAALLDRDIDTTILTRSRPSDKVMEGLGGARWIIDDASESSAVLAAVESAEHIIYCAGSLFPAESVSHPWEDVALALKPLLALLEVLREHRGVALTYLSSGGTVYGNPTTVPISEAHPTEPITAYGVSKLAAEKYIGLYRELHHLPSRILRCANVYGEGQPGRRGQGAVAAFLDCAHSGSPAVLFGDGSIARDFVHVSDIVATVLSVLDRRDGPPVLNVGSGRGTSLKQLLNVVEEVTGREMAIVRRPDRPFDARAIVLDISALTAFIDFNPLPLREGIVRTWPSVHAEATALFDGVSSARLH